MANHARVANSWTCCRSMDGSKVQIDFILTSSCLDVPCAWNNKKTAVGSDHRCVHCQLEFPSPQPFLRPRKRNCFKHWQPYRDTAGEASIFHARVSQTLEGLTVQDCSSLEKCLQVAATIGGSCKRPSVRLKPSMCVTQLRLQRRTCQEACERKRLSFQIRRQQRLEVRQWKSQTLDRILRSPMGWRHLHAVNAVFGRKAQQHGRIGQSSRGFVCGEFCRTYGHATVDRTTNQC